uniref:Beta'-coat protein n=1 Tax=Arion vulgaris TaxID=1028688 RepID=A0A0B7B2C4_9EUPU
MPLKLKIKRRLLARSDRVKSIELHPTLPWMLVSLYSGRVYIWNIESKQIVKTLEVCDLPVRTARFVSRKNWIITGSDDTYVRVFNYNTLEHVIQFAAHLDYIRSIAVHPTNSLILTTADDGIIKLWDWEKKWVCSQIFRGHTYLIMQVLFNPKDNNQFATASLDRSVKVWQLGSPVPNFSLKHERDVNCLDYHPGGDKPYIVTGEDGGTVRIWDYQTKSCVQTLQVHSKDVNAVVFHPSLPIILSGSTDGTVRIIHSNTYRLENSLNYGLERVWAIGCHQGSNNIAIGFDEGSMIIRLGQEEPAISMDSSGKIIWAKHSEIQQANIKAMADQEIKDGERLSLAVKDMGSCEIYPQTISHSPNGRFVALCGDGEYIIYTAMALRNKSYGTAQEFVWSQDSSIFAVREDSTTIKVWKNFKEHKIFKPSFGAEGMYGGHLLGVRSSNSLAFYDWDSAKLIRRVEISPKNVVWSDNGCLVCIAKEDSLYVLQYNASAVEKANEVSDDGIEEALEVVKELSETVRTGLWVGDCFIYTNSISRLNYYVGGEIVTIAHLDREMYILGYIPKDNRLYLSDRELSIVSYSVLVSELEYQTAVMRQDFDTADKILPIVPKEQRTRLAMFLDKQGFRTQALAVTTDSDHKFDLAIQLGDLKTAYSIAKQQDSVEKWKLLSELAMKRSEFGLFQECLHRSQDFGGLLLLATSAGIGNVMTKLAQEAADSGQNNVAFLAQFMLGRLEECLEILIRTKRLPEAAFFARSYMPSQISRVVELEETDSF